MSFWHSGPERKTPADSASPRIPDTVSMTYLSPLKNFLSIISVLTTTATNVQFMKGFFSIYHCTGKHCNSKIATIIISIIVIVVNIAARANHWYSPGTL